jgi:hypothetical protein
MDKKVDSAKLEISFQLGDKLIDSAVVKALTFQSFADCITEAQALQPATKSFDSRLRRVRLVRQVTYYANGSVVQVSTNDVLKISISDIHKIIARLDTDEGKAGKIIRDGDGIEKAIIYELGTPIPVGAGKEPIRELEFHAKTYGDIEDIMSGDTVINQTAIMISTLAKPLGSSLTALPSWALNAITVADGVTISRDVLPRFLGSPDE